MNRNFRDMLVALCEEQADFLVVGAYALAAHGYPRYTGDIDIWIRRSPENAERVWAALRKFRAPLRDLTIADLQCPDIVFQIGAPPQRIDLLTSISGIEFDAAWGNHIHFLVDGRTIPTIGREALIINKRASGRPKDLGDLSWLESQTPN